MTTYLRAEVRQDDGLVQSTASIDDDVWAAHAKAITEALAARGYDVEASRQEQPGEAERHLEDLAGAFAWIDTLNPDED